MEYLIEATKAWEFLTVNVDNVTVFTINLWDITCLSLVYWVMDNEKG